MLSGIYFIVFTIKYSHLDNFVKITNGDYKKKMKHATQIFSPEAFFFSARDTLYLRTSSTWLRIQHGLVIKFVSPFFFGDNHRIKSLLCSFCNALNMMCHTKNFIRKKLQTQTSDYRNFQAAFCMQNVSISSSKP